jgi:hypothetical protein
MTQQRTLTLSDEEQQALIEHRNHDPHPQVRERCAALLKIAAGQSAFQVAQTGLLKSRDSDTVYQWLDFYEQEGLSGLIGRLHGGVRRGFP